MQNITDERLLVKQILSGNRQAFVQLVQQYQNLVLHIVTPLAGDYREDICQEVFIKVYEKLHTFRFNAKLGTWIGNIAYNASVNYLRKKRIVLPENNLPADLADDEEMLVNEENAAKLNEAIKTLSQMQRSVLLLFYYDDISLDDIAHILQMPVNTVKSHLQRARKNLKELLTT